MHHQLRFEGSRLSCRPSDRAQPIEGPTRTPTALHDFNVNRKRTDAGSPWTLATMRPRYLPTGMDQAPERISRRVFAAVREGRRWIRPLDEEVTETVDRVTDVDLSIVVGVGRIAAEEGFTTRDKESAQSEDRIADVDVFIPV